MDVSVIIISWNVREMLAECLRSVEKYHGAKQIEILVIDSASSDDSAEMIRADFPQVRLWAETENIGFVKGNNLGFQQAQGRYLFLLNPDTLLHPHALANLIDYMDEHPQVGIIGGHTLNTDGTHQSTRRRFPTLLTAAVESTWLQGITPKSWLDSFYARDLPDSGIFEVDWVQGSALIARREVYEQIGGLDTDYAMYFEELDWCKRAKAQGWEVVYHGEAFITHHGGKSSEQVTARKHIHFQQSKLHYFRKFHGRFVEFFLRLILIANYGLQVLIEGTKLALGHKRELRRERIQQYGQVLKSLTTGEKGVNP